MYIFAVIIVLMPPWIRWLPRRDSLHLISYILKTKRCHDSVNLHVDRGNYQFSNFISDMHKDASTSTYPSLGRMNSIEIRAMILAGILGYKYLVCECETKFPVSTALFVTREDKRLRKD